jgi:3-hydroxyisobutyrate dehydrogenase-like beta-hydroxyacid dehydrogenase
MAEARKEYGVVGLGRMGGNLAQQALEKGIRVAPWLWRPRLRSVRARRSSASVGRDASEASYASRLKHPIAERSLLR